MNFFKESEFRCKCCEGNIVNEQLIDMLNCARFFAGFPFKINSGYRCEENNNKVGGKENSSHLKGYACDIQAKNGIHRLIIVKSLLRAGFRRIGVSSEFIHCDIDPEKVESMWTY